MEERWDPNYFVVLKAITENITDKTSCEYFKVKKVCKIKRGKFTHRPRNDPKLYDGDYPFIQTGDIVKASNGSQVITYTQTLNELGKNTSALVNPPKLLMTIAANIGSTAILDFTCCYPDSIVAISPLDKEKLSIDYLNIYFNIFQKYLENLAPFAAQRNLNNEQLGDFPIVVPSKEVQNNIILKFENAIQQKQQKEQQAQDLLNSIDIYLLQELGIQLPNALPNTIKSRMFSTSWKHTSGSRIDPKKYTDRTTNLYKAIKNASVPLTSLKKLIIQSASGDWGADEEVATNSLYQKCLVIRATEFDNQFNLNIENSRAKYRYILKYKLQRLDIRPDDLLLEKSGGSPDQPVGRIAILKKGLLEAEFICFSNFIHKFRVNTNLVVPEYLFSYLKTIHSIGLTDTMQSQTNGIRNLILSEYWNQQIPLPTKEKQLEIATHVSMLRNEAKRFQTEASQGFAQTKKEIEQLILS